MSVIVYINGANSGTYNVGSPITHVSTDSHRIGRDLESYMYEVKLYNYVINPINT